MPRWRKDYKTGTQRALELKQQVRGGKVNKIDTGIRSTPRATYEEPIMEAAFAGIGEIRPSYYGCGDVHEVYKCLMAWGLKANAHLWTAVVYLSRAGKKDPRKYIEDLEKAITWIQIEIRECKAKIERDRDELGHNTTSYLAPGE